MRQETVKTLPEFVKRTDFFDLLASTVIFRGQPVKGNLLPSIARNNPRKNTTNDEIEILEQLNLMGAIHLDGEPNDLDLLVIAQHFCMKTRLLDWSSNPFAAMWFACSDKQEGDVYVYALEADNLLNKKIYGNSPFEQAATRVFQPKLNNSRILAQHGWFTVHRYSAKSKRFVALEKNPNINPHLTEFVVPEVTRSGMLRSLDRHGINSRTLFPDLEGLCKYLNWRYENA